MINVVIVGSGVVGRDVFSIDSCIVIVIVIILHNNNYIPHCVYGYLACYYCYWAVNAMNPLLLLCEL